jgi:PEGA domain-containing protein
VPRPGAGEGGGRQPSHGGGSHGGHGHHGGGYYGGYGGYYNPWYYGYGYPYGYGWGWGWGGWWWPWGPAGVVYDRPYHGGGEGGGYGALDVDIWPGETEIYVDGDRVGTADDFDGFPTYLWLPRGTYDVVFYLPGFQTLARQYSIYDGLVIDVEDRLERGEAVRPEDLPSKSTVNRDDRLRRDAEREEAARRHEDWRRRQDESDQPPAAAPEGGNGGLVQEGGNAARLRLDVSPDDASVYLDGNFLGTARELEQLSAGLVVAPGSHRVEVVRPGYRAEEVHFEGISGEEVPVEVELEEE